MSLVDLAGSTFEKLMLPRVAATAALASLILLIVSASFLAFHVITQLDQASTRQDSEAFAIIRSNMNSPLAATTAFAFAVFVTSCSSLIIALLVAALNLLKESLDKLVRRIGHDLKRLKRLQRKQSPSEESKGIIKVIQRLRHIQVIYPYFIILFDVIFYTSIAVTVLTAITVIGMVIYGNLPYRWTH